MKNSAVWIFVLAGLVLAQQGGNTQKSDQDKQQQQKQPPDSQPLFKNKLGYNSSKSTKESTTLGFNGIDPSGKVDQTMMAKAAGTNDQAKVKQMAENRPNVADLRAFLKEGGLKER